MTLSAVMFAFEILLAVLLAVMIRFAWQMRVRIDALRRDGDALASIIAEFDAASARAEASAAELRTVGTAAQRELGPLLARAQAASGELSGLVERADRAVGGTPGRGVRPSRPAVAPGSPSNWRSGLGADAATGEEERGADRPARRFAAGLGG